MNYLKQLWRAELIGLVSLALVSFPIAIVLVLLFDLGPSAPTGLRRFSHVYIGTCSFAFIPMVTYGAPIFAAHLSVPAFRLIYLLGLAALPGLVLFLVFGSDLGLGLIPYGLVVALTMCGMTHLLTGRLVRKAT